MRSDSDVDFASNGNGPSSAATFSASGGRAFIEKRIIFHLEILSKSDLHASRSPHKGKISPGIPAVVRKSGVGGGNGGTRDAGQLQIPGTMNLDLCDIPN